MPSVSHLISAPVLPGSPGFNRMSAAAYNAILLANPSARNGGAGISKNTKRASPEEDLHRLVFGWIFQMEECFPLLGFMMHSPNGGARSKGEAGKLKAMGVRKGVPDVICPFACGPWKGFACELKAPKGTLTPEQDLFLVKARADGWLTGVCFDLESFVALAQTFLGTRAGALLTSTSKMVIAR